MLRTGNNFVQHNFCKVCRNNEVNSILGVLNKINKEISAVKCKHSPTNDFNNGEIDCKYFITKNK